MKKLRLPKAIAHLDYLFVELAAAEHTQAIDEAISAASFCEASTGERMALLAAVKKSDYAVDSREKSLLFIVRGCVGDPRVAHNRAMRRIHAEVGR